MEQDFLRKTGGKITGCGGIRNVSQGGKELLKMKPGIGNSDTGFLEMARMACSGILDLMETTANTCLTFSLQ